MSEESEILETRQVLFYEFQMSHFGTGYLPALQTAMDRLRAFMAEGNYGEENDDWFIISSGYNAQSVFFKDGKQAMRFKLSWTMEA